MSPIRTLLAFSASFLGLVLGASLASGARLATDVAPTSQTIRLRVDPERTDYSGSVRIELEVRRPTSSFQLHSLGPALGRVALSQDGASVPVTPAAGERGLLTLTAGRPLTPGAATLEIDFTNAYDTRAVSLYRAQKDDRAYLFTQFQADHAREAFPCFDEPAFKIPYRITVEVPAGQEAVSNTPIERESESEGWRVVEFKRTPPLPSYLLALAVGPLEYAPIPGVAVPARIVTVQGKSDLAGHAIEVTAPILRALEEWFGTPYPFEKLDLIAVPEFWAGAMENPGAITYREEILLVPPAAATPNQLHNLTRITAHELAHMWFGDLVTLVWWDDMWLNESFADWLGDKITTQLYPQYEARLSELGDIQEIMAADVRPSTEPIRIRAETGSDAMRAVGVAYNKGKSVLGMFEQWMGPETFRRGIQAYLTRHAWGNAEAQDLWNALGAASDQDVKAMMSGFVDQNGIPLVRVEILKDGVRLSQTRLLDAGVGAEPRTWAIPVTLAWSDGRRRSTESLVLGAEPRIVRLAGGSPIAWVMPNAGATGYYRWSVPRPMLLALAHDAATAMDPAERIGFLGNLRALLGAGEVHGDDYLATLAEMADDPHPMVAAAVIAGLGEARHAFVSDRLRPAFARYVRHALGPMAERFGIERRPGEAAAVSRLRPELLAWLGREGRDPAVLRRARELAERYLEDPAAVDPAIAATVLQLHALDGDAALFHRYVARAAEATSITERQRFIGALGHFENPALTRKALDFTLSGALRPTELGTIPGAIRIRSDADADLTLEWLRANHDRIAERVPPAYRTFFASYANGCSRERLEAVRRLLSDPARKVQGTELALAKAADRVEECAGLRQREGAAAAAYLEKLSLAD